MTAEKFREINKSMLKTQRTTAGDRCGTPEVHKSQRIVHNHGDIFALFFYLGSFSDGGRGVRQYGLRLFTILLGHNGLHHPQEICPFDGA